MRDVIIRMLKQALEAHAEINVDEIDRLLVDLWIVLAFDGNKAKLLAKRENFSLPVFKFAKQVQVNPLEFAKSVSVQIMRLNDQLDVPIISECWADGGYVNLGLPPHVENSALRDNLNIESLLKPKDSV